MKPEIQRFIEVATATNHITIHSFTNTYYVMGKVLSFYIVIEVL